MSAARFTRLLTAAREAPAFAVVGAGAYVVDVLVFNLVQRAGADPFTAKTVSMLVSAVASYLGNRLWVFRRRDGGGWRGAAVFLLLNLVALLPSLGCLALAHLAGLTSKLELNVAANVVGTGIGTLFRFVTYRRLVFQPSSGAVPAESQPAEARRS